jgi:hypothetical protein
MVPEDSRCWARVSDGRTDFGVLATDWNPNGLEDTALCLACLSAVLYVYTAKLQCM